MANVSSKDLAAAAAAATTTFLQNVIKLNFQKNPLALKHLPGHANSAQDASNKRKEERKEKRI